MNARVDESPASRSVPGSLFFPFLVAGLLGIAVLTSGVYAVLAIVGAIVFGLFLRHPIWGVYLTTALLLLSGSSGVLGISQIGVPVTVAKLCGLLTFAAWLTMLVLKRQRFRMSGALALLLLFMAWVFLGTARSASPGEQFPEFVRLATLAAFFLMTIHLLDSPEKVHRFLVLIAVCGIVMAGCAIFQYFMPSTYLEGGAGVAGIGAGAEGAFVDVDSLEGGPAIRVSGRAGHSNWLAMILLLLFPLNLYWFNTASTWRARALSVLATASELVALVLTFTRTGFIVGITILVMVTVLRQVRITPQRVCAVAVALVIGWFILPGAYKERVLKFHQYTGSESVNYRIQLQEAALELTGEHPVFGVGIGGFGPQLLHQGSDVANILNWLVDDLGWNPVFYGAHNMYLQLACETGLVGLVLMLAFFAVLVRGLRRARHQFVEAGDDRAVAMTAAVEVSLMSFLLCAVFLHAMQQKIWWMIAAAAAVIPYFAADALAKKEASATQENREGE